MTTSPTIAVVGGGAAGTLTALHLTRTACRRATALEIVVVEPAVRLGAGASFGTADESHLLNVPAAGMSAIPEDPEHFLRWRRRQAPDTAHPYEFAPRASYSRYLGETLTSALADAGDRVHVRHVRRRAVGTAFRENDVRLTLDDGTHLDAQGVVLATGLPAPGDAWAPDALRDSAFFVPDPWAPGALDVVKRDRTAPADVLVVGTGLTMVDIALGLTGDDARPGRTVHAISRGGRVPHGHARSMLLAAIPDTADWGTSLAEVRAHAERHLAEVQRTTGDWRPAVDGLRFRLSALWSALSEEDRAEFLRTDAGAWNRLRHRMPAQAADALADRSSIAVSSAEVLSAEPLPTGGLRVVLSDARTLEVGWVINCTGPETDIRRLGDPLLDDLLRPRGGVQAAVVATGGMGFRTVEGRILDSAGRTSTPLWTLGAMRRGELWESTAVPEIRLQASALATAVLDEIAPLPRKLADGRLVSGHHPVARPRDPLGLAISTTAEAALAYNTGLERLMRLQSGAEECLVEATALDPDFALAHAALALLGHEGGAGVDVATSLAAAQAAAGLKGDERERSLVDVVTARVRDTRGQGATALLSHLADHPRDVLAVSAAVPTIAFSGVTDLQREAWQLVEGLAPAYGDHWWYISLLAFTRQDQSRFEEAGLLAESALSCEPSSGHAVHALAHVLYETGQHEVGRTWLDHWVAESGRAASHRAHFSWHAALHELALGDTEAVRRRYYSQLAPPTVGGVRSLIDSASLLWRWRMTTSQWPGAVADPAPPVEPVLAELDPALLVAPETPFTALHSGIALAAAGDTVRLAALLGYCESSADATLSSVVAPVCAGLRAVVEEDHARAVELLTDVLPSLVGVGGSAAQREIVEETLLRSLVAAGRSAEALDLLHARLDRRPSPVDARRHRLLVDGAAPALSGSAAG